jgi:hypothetical protein
MRHPSEATGSPRRRGRLAAGSVGAYLHRQFQRPKVAALGRFMERPVIESGKRALASLDIPHLDDGHGDSGNENVEVADELRVVEETAAEVVEMIREYTNILRRGRVVHPLTDSFCDTGS